MLALIRSGVKKSNVNLPRDNSIGVKLVSCVTASHELNTTPIY